MSNSMSVMGEKNLQKTSYLQKGTKLSVTVFTYIFLILMAVIVLFPFYWMIISSLKTLDEYRLSQPTFFPKVVMFSNYSEAFTTASLGRLFVNTMIVGVASTLLSLVIFQEMPKVTYFISLVAMAVGAWLCSKDEPIFKKKKE